METTRKHNGKNMPVTENQLYNENECLNIQCRSFSWALGCLDSAARHCKYAVNVKNAIPSIVCPLTILQE